MEANAETPDLCGGFAAKDTGHVDKVAICCFLLPINQSAMVHNVKDVFEMLISSCFFRARSFLHEQIIAYLNVDVC